MNFPSNRTRTNKMQINRENQRIRTPIQWLTACVLGALIAAPSIALAETPKQPNIVLLISDDDDYEHFGFMGSEIAHTPALDKLASEGTLFPMAHCPAPLCRPSLASMLSGKLPHQHGIYSNYLEKAGIGNDTTKLDPRGSLANRLKAAGYASYASGKYWEDDARKMGFTHGTAETTMKGFRHFVRNGQDELFTFIDDQGESKPMFIWWAPLVPHTPHNPPQKHLDRFADAEIPIPSFYKGNSTEYVNAMKKFYAMGTWFDDGVGQLVEKLKAAGEYDNTLFLFYVDNGWAVGKPAKNSPTEKGLRTPMFVTWPKGGVPAGKRVDSLNYALDLHATALDYAGLQVPSDLASKSLRPQIEGSTTESHDVLFGAVYAHNAHLGDPSVKRSAERDLLALYARTDRWKYVLYAQDVDGAGRYVWMIRKLWDKFDRKKGDQDLYDLSSDPYEENNLVNQPDQRQRAVDMRQQVLDWWQRTGGGALSVAKQPATESATESAALAPRVEQDFSNGKDLTGWKAQNMRYWSVKDGAIVGTGGEDRIPGNTFLWHKVPVKDFYLSLKVRQTPYSANAGIQFRSQRKGTAAHGYQADVGEGWWGTVYHEHGRRILARSLDTDHANIKREDWNNYEILAVGHRIWLAINGKITVAMRDEVGELEGYIALQIHGGQPQNVAYKDLQLIHNPPVELIGKNEAELNRLLVDAPKVGAHPSTVKKKVVKPKAKAPKRP